ncbi:MAG: hypothetical protein O7B26_13750 [Planctomycetota bacterium]|nr:hypothetical protein [Planctomycetota bacterium]
MSILLLPFAVLLLPTIVAVDDPAKPAPSLRTEVINALRRSALDGFAGTVKFEKVSWPPASTSDGKPARQVWTVTTDGNGQVRVELDWPNSGYRMLVADSFERTWMSLPDELVVVDKSDPAAADERVGSRVLLMGNIERAGRRQLEWLIGEKVSRGSVVKMLLLDRHPNNTRAVVEIDQRVLSASFVRVDDDLLLVSETIEDDGVKTNRWRYSDYQRVHGRWIPGSVRHSECGPSGTDIWSYSKITLTAASDSTKLEKKFVVPQPGEADFRDALVVFVLSKEVTVEAPSSISRLQALNRDERGLPNNR